MASNSGEGSGQGRIKQIDRTAIHRICSGQVVLDLATAVKELVENSLDAGATNIEIRLKDHGAELIEVIDNGTGVSPDNYQGLTLKYHTSKISNFSDLQTLSSFGFRGEALSSLCALAKVSIVTRTKNEPIAVRLQYDHSGVIVSKDNLARPVGTTVIVEKLFSPLPVRYKELRRENNLRREYGKLLSVLQAYALIAKGVRIICSHQTGKAGRNVVVQTQGNTSMRDNLVTIFGTKVASCMERVDLAISDTCSVEGFLSKPGAGCGRPSGDRQFLYVNGRPVDLPKVVKLLNELYRSFNSLQYPMAVLNFTLPTTAYDVNVTPDKRKLFLHSENELLAALRGSLEQVYTPTKYTYAINSLENGHLSQKGTSSNKKTGRSSQSLDNSVPSDALTNACPDEEEGEKELGVSEGVVETETATSNRGLLSLLAFQYKVKNESTGQGLSEAAATGSASTASRESNVPNVQSEKRIQPALVPCASRAKRTVDESHGVLTEVPLLKRWRQLSGTKEDETEEADDIDANEVGVSNIPSGSRLETSTRCGEKSSIEDDEIISHTIVEKDLDSNKGSVKSRNMIPYSNGKRDKRPAFRSLSKSGVQLDMSGECIEPDICADAVEANARNVNQLQRERPAVSPKFGTEVDCERKVGQSEGSGEEPIQESLQTLTQDQEERIVALISSKSKVCAETKAAESEHMANSPQQTSVIHFDIEEHRKRMQFLSLQGQMNSSSGAQMPRRKSAFAAATLNAVGKDDTEKEAVLNAATEELERSFNKADFKKMKVLGQFNLGFILAKLDDDMFIIDQHASDEKYNFERLSKTTVLNRQPLFSPLGLDLSAAEEMTVMSHIETFRKNGFDFVDDENAPAGRRLKLSAVPFSQNITFGVGDVQELISLLADQPVMSTTRKDASWLPRPSRVRAMLASRACRSSVMIGDPLSKKEMERIVSHLAELDSPWNCPHGRPTMRHLLDLSSIKNIPTEMHRRRF